MRERKQGEKLRGRKESVVRRMTEEGGREVVRRRMERNEGEEGERESVRKRMERKFIK